MSKANEPAFPEITTTEIVSRFFGTVYGNVSSSGGLTKREYFALHLLQAILASGKGGEMENKIFCAVDTAEKLIAELEKDKKN